MFWEPSKNKHTTIEYIEWVSSYTSGTARDLAVAVHLLKADELLVVLLPGRVHAARPARSAQPTGALEQERSRGNWSSNETSSEHTPS